MTRLVVTEFVSLDGVMEAPGGGDHPHAGWTFKDVAFDEAAYELKGREMEAAGALLIGRRSYDEFAPVWPSMEEFAVYNAMPKYVVTSSPVPEGQWHDTRVLGSLDEVAALKESGDVDGDLLVHGSATLVQGLLAAGLVDRLQLLVFPLLLGAGRRLFDTGAPDKHGLELVEHAAYGNGITLAVYDVRR